ncbi:hypothetical protein LEP3755_54990 [Leptolyngbya sp. NIES-3755]|nr:hypothetical protein LEP3755_54990 [Leptolyngbya sp. NIES-3755]
MSIPTAEEIAQFRLQLADRPEAIVALDVIAECEGDLEEAIVLLMVQEMGIEPDRGFNDVIQKCRKVICQEEIRNDLMTGLIPVAIEPVSMSVGIPPGVATAVVLSAYKMGIKKFCAPLNS